MKNAQFDTNDIKKCCENRNKLGIEFRKSGKEYNGWFKKEGKKICRITLPKGRKDVGKGLYRSIARQLKLAVDDFDDLLECPLDRVGYEKLLKDQDIIL